MGELGGLEDDEFEADGEEFFGGEDDLGGLEPFEELGRLLLSSRKKERNKNEIGFY